MTNREECIIKFDMAVSAEVDAIWTRKACIYASKSFWSMAMNKLLSSMVGKVS